MLKRILMVMAALTALSFAFAGTASAQYNPVVVTPSPATPGGTITVTGSCGPDATAEIRLTQVSTGTVIMTRPATTDADGNFSLDITLPSNLEPGTYRADVICDGTVVDSANFEVVAESVTPTTTAAAQQPGPSQPSEPIVRTGSDVGPLSLGGVALLTVGGILVVASRRRRSAEA